MTTTLTHFSLFSRRGQWALTRLSDTNTHAEGSIISNKAPSLAADK